MALSNVIIISLGSLFFISVFVISAFNPFGWKLLKLQVPKIDFFREKNSPLKRDIFEGHKEVVFAGTTLASTFSGTCYSIIKDVLHSGRDVKMKFIMLDPKLGPDNNIFRQVAERRGENWTNAAVYNETKRSLERFNELKNSAEKPDMLEMAVIRYVPGVSMIFFGPVGENSRIIFTPHLSGVNNGARLSFDFSPLSGEAYTVALEHFQRILHDAKPLENDHKVLEK